MKTWRAVPCGVIVYGQNALEAERSAAAQGLAFDRIEAVDQSLMEEIR